VPPKVSSPQFAPVLELSILTGSKQFRAIRDAGRARRCFLMIAAGTARAADLFIEAFGAAQQNLLRWELEWRIAVGMAAAPLAARRRQWLSDRGCKRPLGYRRRMAAASPV
jgi:hypothetical protein